WNGDRLIGFAAGNVRSMPQHLGGERVGALTHIHVLPEHREQGLGKQLALALMDAFKDHGLARMSTDVLVKNEASLAFFKSLGMHEDHVILYRDI
ncbi:MAG: GNAT family N-acetyltransferase, partial [Flavobacteriales bacterium]|nr:GNAT family N-acetyltransferase [Flavobacteriales bacterium]